MTDYAGFEHGAVTYPLPVSGLGEGGSGASFLRDADPVIFYVLEFYSTIINTHLRTRFLSEVVAGNVDMISAAVAETLPLNPSWFLTEEHIRFPLLAAHRKSSKFENIGGRKHSVDTIEVAYVLPPMQAGEAERLLPMLKAVVNVLDNRTEQGMDPTYTPTAPVGTAGEHVWTRAGVAEAEIQGAEYGGYAPTDDLYFPAVTITLEVKELSTLNLTELDTYNGVDGNIDLEDPTQETTVVDFVEVNTYPAPTVTVASPSTGTKAGGTSVTLTGTGFRAGTTPTVLFGGLAATNVVVVNATTVTCVTPAHDAFTTFAADVVLTNIDGQSGTLAAGFTFTTP